MSFDAMVAGFGKEDGFERALDKALNARDPADYYTYGVAWVKRMMGYVEAGREGNRHCVLPFETKR